MSISHQRRQGDGTVDGQILQNLQELNQHLKSDLYLTALEYNPSSILIPVAKSWFMDFTIASEANVPFDGLYFGKFQITHSSQDEGNNDNSHKRSKFQLFDRGAVVAQTEINIHGDDILAWDSTRAEHYGYATLARLKTVDGDEQPIHSAIVSFIGHKVVTVETVDFLGGFYGPNTPSSIEVRINGNTHVLGSSNGPFDFLDFFLPNTLHAVVKNNTGVNINVFIVQKSELLKLLTPGEEFDFGPIYNLGDGGFYGLLFEVA